MANVVSAQKVLTASAHRGIMPGCLYFPGFSDAHMKAGFTQELFGLKKSHPFWS
jgi:hypothetical protein